MIHPPGAAVCFMTPLSRALAGATLLLVGLYLRLARPSAGPARRPAHSGVAA